MQFYRVRAASSNRAGSATVPVVDSKAEVIDAQQRIVLDSTGIPVYGQQGDSRAVGVAEEDGELVTDQFAATAGEDGGRHAQYYWLALAETHLTGRLFGSMVRRMDALVATG